MAVKTLFNTPPKQDGYDFRIEKQNLSRVFQLHENNYIVFI